MKLLYCFVFTSFFHFSSAKANDSTLYAKRVQKICEFSEWLSKRINPNLISTQYDTSQKILSILDTSLNIFFNRQFLDSAYNNKENGIFDKSLKFQMLRQEILNFLDFSETFTVNKLKFIAPNYDKYLINDHDSSYIKNSIINYLVIDKEKFEILVFVFDENSTELISLLPCGFEETKYNRFWAYYNSLKRQSYSHN